MSKVTMEVPATVTLHIKGADYAFDLERMLDQCGKASILDHALHGIKQRLGDAAAGKSGEDAREAIEKKRDALESGEATTRKSRLSDLERAAINLYIRHCNGGKPVSGGSAAVLKAISEMDEEPRTKLWARAKEDAE